MVQRLLKATSFTTWSKNEDNTKPFGLACGYTDAELVGRGVIMMVKIEAAAKVIPALRQHENPFREFSLHPQTYRFL